jgi:membrane fusion protein, macrolide-specific efflux system
MISKKSLIAVIIVIAVCVLAGFFVCGRKKNAPVVEKIVSPRYGDISVAISATGTVLPKNRLEIKPAIGGRVESILVLEGQPVRSGQILAWMSSTERAALIDAARAQGAQSVKYWEEAYRPIPIIAPISGTVIVRSIEPGQSVTEATPILVLSDRLIVRADVDETDIGRVKVGQPVVISLDAYPDVQTKGNVELISFESKTVNNVTMYEVDIIPEKVPAVFRSGMTSNVDIIEKTDNHSLLLPVEAVYTEKQASYVWYMKNANGAPVKKTVKTGVTDDRNVEILSGLAEGDRVAVIADTSLKLDAKNSTNPFMPARKEKKSSGQR